MLPFRASTWAPKHTKIQLQRVSMFQNNSISLKIFRTDQYLVPEDYALGLITGLSFARDAVTHRSMILYSQECTDCMMNRLFGVRRLLPGPLIRPNPIEDIHWKPEQRKSLPRCCLAFA